MSSDKAVKADELETKVNNDEPEADPTPSEIAGDEEARALEQHKKEVFEGMIASNIAKVASGELKIEDIKGAKMRKEVESRLKKNLSFIAPEKSEASVIDEDALLNKFEERAELKVMLGEISEEERDTARQEYDLLAKAKGHKEALKAVQKLHGIETDEEKRFYAERSHKVGVASKTLDAIDGRKLNSTEKAMMDYIKNKSKK